MKTIAKITILLFTIAALTSCNDTCEEFVSYYQEVPVYSTTEAVRNSVSFDAPIGLENPGKIYSYQGLLFINEIEKGVHIFDNTDPSRPDPVGFLSIPGNFDIAIQNGFLFADSYVDLVIFEIGNQDNIEEVNRLEGVFTNYYSTYGLYDENQGIVTSYKEELVETSFETDCQGNYGIQYARPEIQTFSSMSDRSSTGFSGGGSTTGVGGSMARFTIADQALYTLDITTLRTFDISTIDSPIQQNNTQVGWDMETIFPYGDHLFMGSTTGMHIYSIENALKPSFVSTYEHINSCDPVVVQGDLAYVTLRSGTECAGFTNQLDVIDVSNLEEPKLLKTYEMQNPHGLGIIGNCLFVCEGDFGLKFFNAEDPMNIDGQLMQHYTEINAFDVIPLPQSLLMIGSDGLFQYSYSCDNGEMDLLSVIAVAAL